MNEFLIIEVTEETAELDIDLALVERINENVTLLLTGDRTQRTKIEGLAKLYDCAYQING